MDEEPSFRVSTAQRVRAAFQGKYTNPLNFKQHGVSRPEEQKENRLLRSASSHIAEGTGWKSNPPG